MTHCVDPLLRELPSSIWGPRCERLETLSHDGFAGCGEALVSRFVSSVILGCRRLVIRLCSHPGASHLTSGFTKVILAGIGTVDLLGLILLSRSISLCDLLGAGLLSDSCAIR
jgi:hypothetical protein